MKFSVNFDYICYYTGEKKSLEIEFDRSELEFKDRTVPNKLKQFALENGTDGAEKLDDEFTITVQEQLMEWLDGYDKTEIMHNNDMGTILDYHISKVESKDVTGKNDIISAVNESFNTGFDVEHYESAVCVSLIYELTDGNEQLRNDALAVMASIYENIHDLPAVKQYKIVFDGLGVAYKSSVSTLNRLNESIESFKKLSLDEMKEKLKERKQLKQHN